MNQKSSITVSVSSVLCEIGFLRKGPVWNRSVDGLVQVVDLQTSKAGAEVTVNCGVFCREIYEVVWGRFDDDVVSEPLCIARAPVGKLLDGYARWWEKSDPTAPAQIAEVVKDTCVPFLEQFRSSSDVLAYLEASAVKRRLPLEVAYLAVLMHSVGRTGEACELLSNLQQKALGDWRHKAGEVAARLGCCQA